MTLRVLSRLLLVAALSCVAVPAQAGDAAASSAAGMEAAGAANVSEIGELKERVKELEARERQNYALELEGQRKQVDWWLSFLGIMLAGLAIFVTVAGIAIPYVIARKNKEIFDLDKKIIEQDKVQTRQLLEEVKGMKADAKDSVEEIHRHEEEAKIAKETVLAFQSGTTPESDEKTREAVEKIEQDKTADPLLRLRAEAVAASQSDNVEKAFRLWAALAELVPEDANAQLNASYTAGLKSQNCDESEKLHWLTLVKQYGERALKINPKDHDSIYNLGLAMCDEAELLAATNLEAARALWRQAGVKCQLALSLKPDMHEAAYNWGIALAGEAQWLAATDLKMARALWRQAGEKYQLALSIRPDKHEAVNNWGNALAGEANALASIDLAAARALWRQAGEKYQLALSIKSDKHEVANNWGNVLVGEARWLAETDPGAARALWRQAGEKYQLALSIKPDKHEAASNWGNALLCEAAALSTSDRAEFMRLLEQAERLLLEHAEAAPGEVAYNLACVYGLRADVRSCLKWLKVSQTHRKLPDCKHLREDKDLDPVRDTPEFTEWFKQVCP